MRAVNLLPRETKQRTVKKESVPVLVGACAGVLVFALLVAMFFMRGGMTAAEEQLAGVQSPRLSALSTALSTRVAWDRVFREFSLVLPDDVWLTMLSAKSPISPSTGESSSTSTAPSQFTINGRTYSHDAVARMLSRLQVVPDLTNVQLLSSSRSEVAGQEVVDFSIAADIKVLGGPSS